MNRLVWFRNDLRLHDNESIAAALSDRSADVAFLYVFDSRLEPLGQAKQKFLAECVDGVKQQLQSMGSDLICVAGDPKEIVPEICRQLQINEVFYSRLTAFNEKRDEVEIERILRNVSVLCRSFQSHTLMVDAPNSNFDLCQLMSFSKFKKYVEKSWPIPAPVDTPMLESLGVRALNVSSIELPIWNIEPLLKVEAPAKGVSFSGGERSALEHLHDYIWVGERIRTYKETRNGLIQRTDSSKFSPSLASGSLSVRTLYKEIRLYERSRGANASTLWLLYELLWRDYFHFAASRRGHRLFTAAPTTDVVANRISSAAEQFVEFGRWQRAETKSAFVNAAMTELASTGWLSNRMRQNAASYLIYDLGVDWRLGAKWFETCLVDYDPCSNWGNWAYIAGAGEGNVPHPFNVEQQARAYDPNGEYIELWAQD